MSFRCRKAAAVLPVLLMGVCVAACGLLADDSSTTTSGQSTTSQKPASSTHATVARATPSKTQTHPGPSRPAQNQTAGGTAPHQTVAGTAAHEAVRGTAGSRTTTPPAAKGPNPATTNSTRPSMASRPVQPSAAKPTATRTVASNPANRAATVRSTHSTRSRRARPLTGQQRLARLHLQPGRVREIQEALRREGYLSGEPNGQWDTRTHDAMLRYQADHGFPPTGLPEAKSLMKLGLGSHPLPPELDAGLAGPAGSSGGRGDLTVVPPAPLAAPARPPSQQ